VDDYGAYGAVVFDLDGTLVRLPVDWRAVEREVWTAVTDRGVAADEDATVWTWLDAAEAAGVYDAVEPVVCERERSAAPDARRLPLADDCDQLAGDRPVGVCSLNCERAVRTALDAHDLSVDAVVGRGTVPERKPDPEPLLAVCRRLDVSPEDVLFVGDSASDGTTAERAGTAFRRVHEGGRER